MVRRGSSRWLENAASSSARYSRRRPPNIANAQRGVGFVEILVAIVLLSIGVMAGARMQISGMRFSQSAYLQSQASFMASDIIDRMRSNIDGVQADAYDKFKAGADAVDPGCDTKQCSPKELAEQDRYDWSTYLFPLAGSKGFTPVLPGTVADPASATVTRVAGKEGQFTVEVKWVEEVNGKSRVVPLRVDFVTEY